MNYIELDIQVEPRYPAADLLITELSELGFESFADTPAGFTAYIPEAGYHAGVLQPLHDFDTALGTLTWTEKHIPSQNWNAVWEADFQPVDIGGICRIRAPFHAPAPQGVMDIVIQPQMSFGTGHHATTHLMVEKLLTIDFTGKTVLDLGSGTGVLAIIASLRGAKQVDAVDIEAPAVENARENAVHNAGAQIHVYEGDHRFMAGKNYDMIIANINRNVLLAAMPGFGAALNQGGTLLLSGFFTSDTDTLTTAASQNGLTALTANARNEWALIELTRH
ncbi:MAG: 50S ribosomal protein L11 methyltransferase [Bacteroidia bacterium]|jgi:ribosomal protein L11 methyltransferase|nr:50S ribosomal protein L11 methyltransferase [Bacteroidia bacterium]